LKTDAELIDASSLDAGAFRELYDRHASAIHRFHLSRTGDREAAVDLTAETFAQAWLSRIRFRDLADGSASPWLFGIARNVLASSARKRRLEQEACERLGILGERLHEQRDAPPSERWLADLDQALAELSPDLQEAIQLRVLDDLSYEAVAQSIGATPGAARVRVHRGLKALRERLLQPKEATR
jgi:RNA polymerase sigma-70 factor, ECF subfamily